MQVPEMPDQIDISTYSKSIYSITVLLLYEYHYITVLPTVWYASVYLLAVVCMTIS